MAVKRAALTALALLATVCFLTLGVWQIERRAWKLDLIARVDARIHAAAEPLLPAAQWEAINERDHAYRKVRVTGVFMSGCDTHVRTLTAHGAGFWIMTPLRTSDGVVLINRGFAPTNFARQELCKTSADEETVTVTGLMRMSEPKGTMLRSNDPTESRWYSRDVEEIGRACKIAKVAPFFVDADATLNQGSYPVGGLTVVAFRNSHLIYAVTWFALAGMAMMGIAMLWLGDMRRSWTRLSWH